MGRSSSCTNPPWVQSGSASPDDRASMCLCMLPHVPGPPPIVESAAAQKPVYFCPSCEGRSAPLSNTWQT
eukprot:967043-Pyramimonas_sp.AAC.1